MICFDTFPVSSVICCVICRLKKWVMHRLIFNFVGMWPTLLIGPFLVPARYTRASGPGFVRPVKLSDRGYATV